MCINDSCTTTGANVFLAAWPVACPWACLPCCCALLVWSFKSALEALMWSFFSETALELSDSYDFGRSLVF